MKAKWICWAVTFWVCISSGSVFASDLIHTTATVSQARADLAATTVGNKALFGGGYTYMGSTSAYYDCVDIYDADTGQWTMAQLSHPRGSLAATSVGTKAMFAGGWRPFCDTVDIYDAATNTWSVDHLSLGREELAAASAGGKALFAGGYYHDGQRQYTDLVDIYNGEAGTWSTARLSQGRCYLVGVSCGSKAFFAGGIREVAPDEYEYSDVVDIYDAESGSWSTASLSYGRSNMAAVAAGDKVFFAGGANSKVPFDFVDIYDTRTDTWTTAHLSRERCDLAAGVVGDYVIFAGGYEGSNVFSDAVDIYDMANDAWFTDTLAEPRSRLVGVSLDDRALFATGQSNWGQYSPMVDIYIIPEPTVLCLLTCCGVALALRRRRQILSGGSAVCISTCRGGRNLLLCLLCIGATVGLASNECPAADKPYFVGISWQARLYHIDPHTGKGSFVADTGLSEVDSMARDPSGVIYTSSGGTYATSGALHTINPATGQVLTTVSLPIKDIRGLAFDLSGRLYALNLDTYHAGGRNELFIVDTTSGDATSLGKLNVNGVQGLTFGPDGTLYGWEVNALGNGVLGYGLVTIDLHTLICADVDPAWNGHTEILTLDFDGDGILYGCRDFLYTVDPSTGDRTMVGAGGFEDIRGMAYIPEPATLSLLALGGLVLIRRRSRK